MKFPIDIEAHIAAMREQYSPDAKAEAFYRDYYLPALNEAYQDGRTGKPEFKLDSETEIAAFERIRGPMIDWSKRLIAALIHDMNTTYAQGQQDEQGNSSSCSTMPKTPRKGEQICP